MDYDKKEMEKKRENKEKYWPSRNMLHQGVFNIKIDNKVLDFKRDQDVGEDMVGGTMNAT